MMDIFPNIVTSKKVKHMKKVTKNVWNMISSPVSKLLQKLF